MTKSATLKSLSLYLIIIICNVIIVTFALKSIGLVDVNILASLNKIILVVVFYIIFKLENKSFAKYIKIKTPTFKEIVSIFYSSVSVALIVLITVFASILLLTNNTASDIFRTYNLLSVLMFSTVIVSPITEEIIFRGILYNKLKEGFNKKISLLVQALLFALIHVNPLQVVYTFIFGLFFGVLYDRSKSILAVILSHMIVNFVGTYGLSWVYYTFFN